MGNIQGSITTKSKMKCGYCGNLLLSKRNIRNCIDYDSFFHSVQDIFDGIIEKALKKRPKLLIDLLIKEVIIYNDKTEIFYNYTDKSNNPEDKSVLGIVAFIRLDKLYVEKPA